MSRTERMRALLTREFNPTALEVRDESAAHAGHAGAQPSGETHYHITVESEAFRGLSRVATHQRIMAALNEEFRTGLHALSISAKAS